MDKELRVLVVDDSGQALAVKQMLASVDGLKFTIECADTLVAALSALARSSFDVALVELVLPDSQGLSTFETLMRNAGGLPMVIFTSVTNELLALHAVERGAQDFLVKGRITTQALVRVLQYSVARGQSASQSTPIPVTKARMFGMTSAKGGVGTTTLACHYALELKRQTGAKVLMADLDTGATSAAYLMKVKSDYSLFDAATNLHRLDPTFWSGIVATTKEGVDVLQSPGAVGFTAALEGERIRHVLRFAKSLYNHVVIDLGRASTLSMSLVGDLNEVGVVTTTGLPEMFETGRLLRRLLETGVTAAQMPLLFNRVPKSGQATVESFERAIGYAVSWSVPEQWKELEEAYAAGRFLDENLPVRKTMAEFVTKALGSEQKPQSRGLFGLFRLARA